MASKAEIRQRVGEDLSLVMIGGTLESQDSTRIDATYAEVYERLKEEGLATWASTAEVPDAIVPYYILMMEEKLLVTYSVPEARYQRIMNGAGPDGEMAKLKLARLITPDYQDTVDAAGF